MSKTCYFTGKTLSFGNRVARSGAAIKKGGFGLKTSGISRRKFKPNLQKMDILVDGKVVNAYVSTTAIRSGMVVKPLKRKYGYTAQQKSSGR